MNRYSRISAPPPHICHDGIKGQQWGLRRFQNPDGTYTEEGKRRKREYNRLARHPGNKKNKKLRKVSDEVLEAYMERLEKEKRVSDLEKELYAPKKNPNRNQNQKKNKDKPKSFIIQLYEKAVPKIADRLATKIAAAIVGDVSDGSKKKKGGSDDDSGSSTSGGSGSSTPSTPSSPGSSSRRRRRRSH